MQNNTPVVGKAGISAQVVLHSISEQGVNLYTLLIDFPRIVLAELAKHRMLSMSAASSRAIPFAKMQEQLTGRPVRFGAANAGMQDAGEHDDYIILGEPFQMIHVLITGTEWDNFFWLCNDKAADPTIQELARVMQQAMDNSKPIVLLAGQWHLPFVDSIDWGKSMHLTEQGFYVAAPDLSGPEFITLEDAIKVSCARCADTSFRNENYDLAKCLSVYDKLINGDNIHAWATEHCATPMKAYGYYPSSYGGKYRSNAAFVPYTWEDGISHVDRNGKLWSGNFMGFIQYRKTLKGENYVKS